MRILIFSILTILIVCLTQSINTFEIAACNGAPVGTHFFVHSPLSCQQYILCINGQTHRDFCPAGYDFNVVGQNCIQQGTGDCTQCAGFGEINLPHSTSCNQYIQCSSGQRIEQTCPLGLNFDRNTATCLAASLVTCSTPVNPQPDPEVPVIPDPGTPDPGTPEPGTPETGLPICEANGELVQHSHPTDCRLYFNCLNGLLWTHQCPSELHWNVNIMSCDLPENAKCVNKT